MTCRVVIVHYTPPGVVGGVESVIHQHARLLAERGFDVELVAGRASQTAYPLLTIPQIDAASPENALIEDELAAGIVGPKFFATRDLIERQLRPLVQEADAVVVHNAFTLHFSLPLTTVLWKLAEEGVAKRMVAWCHDLSWTNPLYTGAMHSGAPWNLLRTPAPATSYVTVSGERKTELGNLWGEGAERIEVIPNGVDPARFLRLSPATMEIVESLGLFESDLVLLLPVRITRRKNIEAGIRAVKVLKESGLKVRFLVSGPQAPHHPQRSTTYLGELLGLVTEADLSREVVFLANLLGRTLDDVTLSELYAVADVLLFPSAQEGFGLPVIEAGLARLPAVVSDISVFREIGGDDVHVFRLSDSPDTIAECILRASDTPSGRLFRRVLREYRWDAIVDQKIVPLLLAPLPAV